MNCALLPGFSRATRIPFHRASPCTASRAVREDPSRTERDRRHCCQFVTSVGFSSIEMLLSPAASSHSASFSRLSFQTATIGEDKNGNESRKATI